MSMENEVPMQKALQIKYNLIIDYNAATSHRKEHIDENYRYRTSNYDKKRMLEEYQNYGII